MRRNLKMCVVATVAALVLAFVGLISGVAATKAVAAGADTTTTATTDTTTTTSAKPPKFGCDGTQTVPNMVHRSKNRRYRIVMYCTGRAQQASVQLLLPFTGPGPNWTPNRGNRFILKGSSSRMCEVRTGTTIKCWQKRPAKMSGGHPTWRVTDIVPSRAGHTVTWFLTIRVRLSRTARVGETCFDFIERASNGSSAIGPNDNGSCTYIKK